MHSQFSIERRKKINSLQLSKPTITIIISSPQQLQQREKKEGNKRKKERKKKKKRENRPPIHYPLSGLTRAYQRKLRVPRLLHTGQPATSYLTRRLKEDPSALPASVTNLARERAGMSAVLSVLPTRL